MQSVILTSYFSKKPHPNDPNDAHVVGRNHDGFVHNNTFKYIEPWYNSVKSLNLNGVIFHDDLSNEFVNQYATDKINFIKTDVGLYSNLDWRWFCYRNFLESNKFDSVFISDGSDVSIVKDPHDIISEYPNTDLFVCKDSIKLSEFPYIQLHQQANWENLVWFILMQNRLDLINMGVIGGSYNNMLDFLNTFCTTRLKLGDPNFAQADMWIGQYVLRHLLSNKNILVGEPFTSNFKKYEIDRKDVYFIHK